MGSGATEEAKKEQLGAVAIKPPGWDRTGWEAFRYFIYDPDKGTILSRTPKSWILITIFYIIYYSCLAAFWCGCLFIFGMTLPEKLYGPKWQQNGGLIGSNPGIGIRPKQPDYWIDSNLFVFKLSPDAERHQLNYSDRARMFLDDYQNYAVGYDSFDLAKLGPCSQYPYIEYGYSYDYIRPCIFLKLNKIWGWEPSPIDEYDFEWGNWPQSLQEHFNSLNYYERENVFVDCQGRNPADRDALKEIIYFPQTRGFETKFFPYAGDGNYIFESSSVYHSPLVALQLHLDESIVGQLIHIECRVYHKGVWHDTKSKAGLIQFEVMLEK